MDSEKKFNILIYVLIAITAILIIYYLVACNNKDRECDKKEFYGPDMIYTYGPDNIDLHSLISRVYNLNSEMVKKPLKDALKTVSNDERIGVFAIDNPVSLRRAIESNESYHKILAPEIDKALNKRRLKLARNSIDNTIISEPVEFDGYMYPIGQWLFVQRENNIS